MIIGIGVDVARKENVIRFVLQLFRFVNRHSAQMEQIVHTFRITIWISSIDGIIVGKRINAQRITLF